MPNLVVEIESTVMHDYACWKFGTPLLIIIIGYNCRTHMDKYVTMQMYKD